MQPETKYAWSVIIGSVILVAVFHLLVFDAPFGWPLSVWAALLAVFLIALRHGVKSAQNIWAYIFLGPVILTLAAELLYANDVVRIFGLFLCMACYGFFAYWLFAPKASWSSIQNFWPRTWILETIFPIEHKGPWSKIGLGQGSRQALFGVLAAVPFVLVFLGLFLSADPLIGKVLSKAFSFDNPGKLFLQILVDVVIGFYLLRWVWMAFTRAAHNRHPQWFEIKASESRTLYISFLSVLNALFLGFIGFQFVYFFGGQGIVESYGLTYASYAREGFFQLFTVSVIVFLIVYGVTAKTRARSLVVRLLSVALIVQSWIVIASAIKRLTLYVDAYGLSVLRYWALAGLIVAAVALFVLLAWLVARASFSLLEKTLVLGSMFVFSGLLLINYEAVVVDWNANRQPTESVAADYLYPAELSSDAVPSYIAWLQKADDASSVSCAYIFNRLSRVLQTDAATRDEADLLLKRFHEATGNRLPIQIEYDQGDDYYASRGMRNPYIRLYWNSNRPLDNCLLSDWKAALRIFDRENLRQEMSDPRKRTWSGVKALEAYESL